MFKRKDLEKVEDLLAPYAQKSKNSMGRIYKEPEHPYRSCYQRDRDRIIYSTAFRRLEYKTQVFVNHEGDYYRTRLTHTLEVAQIAKSIARAMRLNEDLVEAISLAHDLGHTPFGHSGEDALHEIMKDHGGFDHNTHGLRVVDLLEERYPEFPGLNLSYEVREGIIKHSTMYDLPRPIVPFKSTASPLLEIQVVDAADEIAYDNHDLDDGITSRLIKEEDLRSVGIWTQKERQIRKLYPRLKDEIRKYQIIRGLINEQITDILTQTENNIKRYKIRNIHDVLKLPARIVSFSKSMENLRKPMREFLQKNLYQHYRVVRMSNKASRFISALYNVYFDKPEQLPPSTLARLKKEDKHQVVCDYIAGMTDRYALDEYKKFFEPYERV
ncbi:MAG: deoxyguanosinetriphosphate triphosphohydrolase [Candidatus Omnitrophota bacterium]|nr:deoxyguanosinetriphosphate triphosphohydrolase [Candidatus Omnitrophota bacterium]